MSIASLSIFATVAVCCLASSSASAGPLRTPEKSSDLQASRPALQKLTHGAEDQWIELQTALANDENLEPSRHSDLAREFLSLCQKNWRKQSLALADCHLIVAEALHADFRPAEAELEARQSLKMIEPMTESTKVLLFRARAQSLLGGILEQKGQSKEAEKLLILALTTQEQAGREDIDRFRTLVRLSKTNLTLGKLEAGAAMMTFASILLEKKLSNVALSDRVALKLSEAYLLNLRWKDAAAADVVKSALKLQDSAYAPFDARKSETLEMLGFYQNRSDQLTNAEVTLTRSLELERQRPRENILRLGSSLNSLATNYERQGQFEKAEVLRRKSVEAAGGMDGTPSLALAVRLHDLGTTIGRQGRNADAVAVLRRAEAVAVTFSGTNDVSVSYSQVMLAQELAKMGNYDEAIQTIDRAVSIRASKFGVNNPNTLAAMNYQGSILLGAKRPTEAALVLGQAVAAAVTGFGPDSPDLASLRVTYAQSLMLTGKSAAAHDQLDLAASILGQPAFSRLDMLMAPNRTALSSLGRLNSAAARMAYLYLMSATDDRSSIGKALTAIQVSQRAFDSSAVWQAAARLTAKEPDIQALVKDQQSGNAELSKLRRSLVQAYQKNDSAQIKTIAASMTTQRQDLAARTIKIEEKFPTFFRLASGGGIRIEDLIGTGKQAPLLKNHEALLIVFNNQDVSHVAFISRSYQKVVKIPISTKALTKLVMTLREATDISNSSNPSNLPVYDLNVANQLYKLIIEPFYNEFKDVRTLYVAPDGPLRALPFSLMVEKIGKGEDQFARYRNSSWLGDNMSLVTLPDISALGVLRSITPPSKASHPFLAFADPALQGTTNVRTLSAFNVLRGNMPAASDATRTSTAVCAMQPLPETRKEAQAIAARFGTEKSKIFLGDDANEKNIFAMNADSSLASYKVILFATHGLVAGEAGGSIDPALVLTPDSNCKSESELGDGLLTSGEIATLSLDADWVILSGCNTAGSSGESKSAPLSGLARAFFYAGARKLLVSHWSVDSTATADLISNVFASGGKASAGSLQKAMKAVRNSRGSLSYRAHPAFWGPFVMVGVN
jgi:CHAT domain-containing protein